MKRGFCIFLVLLLLLSGLPATMMSGFAIDSKVIYVDSEIGLDDNEGTYELPVKTLNKALELIVNGGQNSIYLASGTYMAPGVLDVANGTSISLIGEDSVDDTVIYKNPSSTELFYIDRKDGVVLALDNLVLTGDNPETLETEIEGTGIRFYSSHSAGNNRIDISDCTFENLIIGVLQDYSEGLQVNISNSSIIANTPLYLTESESQSIVIESSYLKTLGTYTYSSVISLSGYTGTTFTMTDSIIEGTGVGRGVYGNLVTLNLSGNQFLNLSIALEIDDIRTATIENNYVETSEDGFDIETDYTSHSQIYVRNNTLINVGEKKDHSIGLVVDLEEDITSVDFEITNNTFVNFGLGIHYYGYNTDDTFNVTLGGEGLGNTFRGNIVNIYTERLKTDSKVDLRGTDWGTEDKDEVLLRLRQSSVLISLEWAENVEDVYLLDDVLITSAPENVYVDLSYSVDDSDGYVYGETAFNDIQTALAYVRSGGNVYLADGLYNQAIWIDRPVSLIGSGENTIISGNTAYDSVSVRVTGDDTSISGIQFLGGYHGIKYESSVISKPRSFTVKDCIFTDVEAVSIHYYMWDHDLQNEGKVEILRNKLHRSDANMGSTMINVYGDFEEVFFNDNDLSGYIGYSVSLSTSGNLTVKKNKIISASSYHEKGLYLKSDKDLLMSGNYIESLVPSKYNAGIYLNFPSETVAPNNGIYQKQVFNNRIKGYYYGMSLNGEEKEDIFELTIGGSEANRNNFSDNTYGINSTLSLYELADINATYNIWGVPFESMDSYINIYTGSNIDYIPVANSEPILNSLTISEGNLNPSFDSDIFSYNVSVANDIEFINLNPVAYNGSVTVNGDNVAYGNTIYVTLATGNNTVVIEVNDGNTSTSYTLVITREPEKTPSSGSSRPSIIVITSPNESGYSTQTTITSRSISGKLSANVSPLIMDALLSKATRENAAGIDDSIDLLLDSLNDYNEIQLSIKKSDFNRIVSEIEGSLGIHSNLIDIVFDSKALEAINNVEEDGDIAVIAGTVDPADLNENIRSKVLDRPVYSIQVKAGDQTISHFEGGHAYVTVPYILKEFENPNSIVVYYIDTAGNLKTVRGKYNEGTKSVTFKTPHFSRFAVGYNHMTFEDVSNDTWYYDPVTFIASREITAGTGQNQFSPNSPLTRGQFMVLVMNAYDMMSLNYEVSSQSVANFIDCGNTYYTQYLLKARQLGLTNGIGNDMFGPEQVITRQEMFVMIYNVLELIEELPGTKADKDIENFEDKDSIAEWAYDQIKLLVEKGIVKGDNNLISPRNGATRAEMAQILYNLY